MKIFFWKLSLVDIIKVIYDIHFSLIERTKSNELKKIKIFNEFQRSFILQYLV